MGSTYRYPIKGDSGFSGFSGYSGLNGEYASSGFSGYSGQAGSSGFSGYSGQAGSIGLSGLSGFSGFSGVKGGDGAPGPQGPQGISGYSGMSDADSYFLLLNTANDPLTGDLHTTQNIIFGTEKPNHPEQVDVPMIGAVSPTRDIIINFHAIRAGSSYSSTARGLGACEFQKTTDNATKIAKGDYSFIAGGRNNSISGIAAITGGEDNIANSNHSMAIGYQNEVQAGQAAIALGYQNIANGEAAVALGYKCEANATHSFAIGEQSIASALGSHAENGGYESSPAPNGVQQTTANGSYSHAEGYLTYTLGRYSHTEGYETKADGDAAHAEGYLTTTTRHYAHVGGYYSQAGSDDSSKGNVAFAHGSYVKAVNDYSTIFGAAIAGTPLITNKDYSFVIGYQKNASAATTTFTSYIDTTISGKDLTRTGVNTNNPSSILHIYNADQENLAIAATPTQPLFIENTFAFTAGNSSVTNRYIAYISNGQLKIGAPEIVGETAPNLSTPPLIVNSNKMVTNLSAEYWGRNKIYSPDGATVAGTILYYDGKVWNYKIPPAINGKTYVLSITDRVISWIEAAACP